MPSSRSRSRSSDLTCSRPSIADRACAAVAAARSYGEAEHDGRLLVGGQRRDEAPHGGGLLLAGGGQGDVGVADVEVEPRVAAGAGVAVRDVAEALGVPDQDEPARSRAWACCGHGGLLDVVDGSRGYPGPSRPKPCRLAWARRRAGTTAPAARRGPPGRPACRRHARKSDPMPAFGYTMMCEQARPDQLVRDVQPPRTPVSTSPSPATTTSRGWSPRATPATPGRSSAPPRRPRRGSR